MNVNMFNKLYEWVGSGIATLRDGVPVADDASAAVRVRQDAPSRRKRPFESLEDEDAVNHEEDRAVKKFRIGGIMDTVKNAAEGMKTHGSSVALWMRNSVSPALRNMLPAPPDSAQSRIPATNAANSSGSVWTESKLHERRHETHKDTFVAPTTALEWKAIVKSDFLRTEPPLTTWEFGKRHAHASLLSHEAHTTNGHSVTSCTSKPCPSPRLGRPLYVGAQRSPSRFSTPTGSSTGNSSYTSMYEKTFPIRVVQNPSPGSSGRHWRGRTHSTAQESVREEEKVVYRQLLAMVSGGQSSFLHNSASSPPIRSHRDFSCLLTSSRRLLQCASPAGSGAGESSLGLSSLSTSPQNLSAMHSPCAFSNGPETQSWDADSDGKYAANKTALGELSLLSPAALQDTSSQDTQSSAHDGDSVIFVTEKPGKRPEGSSVPCFQAELWIKELTSLYDARARERRRLIEEQEALASQLLHQRLSDEGRTDLRSVELRVRVPLEKEVPLAPVVEPEPEAKEQEFPRLTEAMENAVKHALRGANQDDVLSEGFRQTITRKDLRTLSNLNWLNDEVINYYMNMLVERSKSPLLPSVYTFNTFFFPKLCSSGYSAVRRWTKKVDVFSVDIILVPVHLGVHWCLSVVDFRKKTITYFDSMGGNDDGACRILLNYLKQESEDKKQQAFNTSDWILHSKKRNEIPQQMNGSDCGMFTCKYAEYITKDKPITFTQKHMPYFRRRMVWEILNRKLL